MPRRPRRAASDTKNILRLQIDLQVIFDGHLPTLPFGETTAHKHQLTVALNQELHLMDAGVLGILPGARYRFSLDGLAADSAQPIVDPLPLDPGRVLVPNSPQVTLDEAPEEAWARIRAAGLDFETPLDIFARPDTDGSIIVMALSLSGLLWVRDVLAPVVRDVMIGDYWFCAGYSADAATRRIAAALPPGSIAIEDGPLGCTLTALTPAGARWVRLCRYYEERMKNAWETTPAPPMELKHSEDT